MSKTVRVETILERANTYFKESPDNAREARFALQGFVSNILFETGNYAGFGYLTPYTDPNCDASRIVMYKSHKL